MKTFFDVPQTIEFGNCTLEKGAILGKGGHGLCYEFKVQGKQKSFAVKAVKKTEYAQKEIKIQSKLNHENVVQFLLAMETKNLVLIVMNKYSSDTLLSLQSRRDTITEPEARYFMSETLKGLQYLHENNVVHCDIKLNNIILSERMVPKIGDFGLSIQGDTRQCPAGTVFFVAPEVTLHRNCTPKRDTWSLGICFYTLLHGDVPFAQNSHWDVNEDACNGVIEISEKISPSAESFIRKMLDPSPETRLSAAQASQHEFFTSGPLPISLPTSCLTLAPLPINNTRGFLSIRQNKDSLRVCLVQMLKSLRKLCDSCWLEVNIEAEANPVKKINPQGKPPFWVSKFLPHPTIGHVGYALNDNTVGVMKKNRAGGILSPDGRKIVVLSADGLETYYDVKEWKDSFPDLNEQLFDLHKRLDPSQPVCKTYESDQFYFRRPFIKMLSKTLDHTFILLSNAVCQISFTDEKPIELIFCPQFRTISIVKNGKILSTTFFSSYKSAGISKELQDRVKIACDIIENAAQCLK